MTTLHPAPEAHAAPRPDHMPLNGIDHVELWVGNAKQAAYFLTRAFGFTAYLRFENLSRLTEAIEGHGVLGPVIFISAYALGVVFFVPALPMTLLGGLAFGPVRGAAYVWVAATIGAALAFLVARYGLRGLVERWVARNARLTRMDEAVARDGWRIVMITRLVPLFPFNLQNYAYGVTRIGFWAYVTTSAVCMIPATVAYTFAGGALSRGGGDLRRTVGYLAVAGVLIVLVSLIPRYLERRNRVAGRAAEQGDPASLGERHMLAKRRAGE